MTSIDYRTSSAEGVLTLTFDRPSARNALNRATRVALVDELNAADGDAGIRVVVLTGEDPAFTSGVDAKEFLGDPDYVTPPLDPPMALRRMSTPTIAAVNGACVSGGLEIALACSFVIASDRARFADTHARIGLSPGWGLTAELPSAVGSRRAMQLALTGEFIDAPTAVSWGIANEVVPHADLLARVGVIAAAITAIDERSVRNTTTIYRDAHAASLVEAREIERGALRRWTIDRNDSRASFGDQIVSPPST